MASSRVAEMKFIGLLMINEENDILERTLAANAPLVDCVYVLDGTANHTSSWRAIRSHGI